MDEHDRKGKKKKRTVVQKEEVDDEQLPSVEKRIPSHLAESVGRRWRLSYYCYLLFTKSEIRGQLQDAMNGYLAGMLRCDGAIRSRIRETYCRFESRQIYSC